MPQMVRAMRAILGYDSFGPGLKARWVSPQDDPLALSTGPSDSSLLGGSVTGLGLPDASGVGGFGAGALGAEAGAGVGALGLSGLASLTVRAEEEEEEAAAADEWLAVGNRASLEDEIDALEVRCPGYTLKTLASVIL